jgi:hypothetical protein
MPPVLSFWKEERVREGVIAPMMWPNAFPWPILPVENDTVSNWPWCLSNWPDAHSPHPNCSNLWC